MPLASLTAVALALCPGCKRDPDPPVGDGSSSPAGAHSLQFDGVDDYASVSHVPGLDASGVTVEAWVRPDGPEVPRANILARRDPGGRGDAFLFRIRADMGGVLEFGVSSGGQAWGMAGNTPIPRERWTHVAVSYERSSGTIRLFVDGELDAERRSPVPALTGEMPVWLGGDPLRGATGRPFAGRIDELRLWDHPRTAEQLAETLRLPLRGDEEGLALLWRMDEGTGQSLADGAGGAVTAILGTGEGDDPSDPSWVDDGPF